MDERLLVEHQATEELSDHKVAEEVTLLEV